MYLKNIYLKNYRNHPLQSLLFSPGINIISGPNASGKTNIVEAIYYLSLARSFRGVEDTDLILKHKEFAEIGSDVYEGEIKRHAHVVISEKGRSVTINGKKVSKISSLVKSVNVLLFEPRDVHLFKGSPKDRRTFLDVNISKEYPAYFENLSLYEKVLKERNEILKSNNYDEKLLETTTELLIKYSGPIISYRQRFVKDINDILIKITRALTGVKGNLEISYKPFVNYSNEFEKDALTAFNRSLESDKRQKATSIGVHREDFSISLNGRDIGKYGSQGENRLVALALKLSPYFLFEDRDKRPIIVLDDVMSELDKIHQKRLVSFLQKLGQVFITATELEIDGATQIKLTKSKEVF